MQKEKVEKMKAEGRDEHEVRKMNEVSFFAFIEVVSMKSN